MRWLLGTLASSTFAIVLGAGLFVAPVNNAKADCPCFQPGMEFGCTLCSGLAQVGFGVIEGAIQGSEEAIKTALGENSGGMLGFPALNDTIEGAVGNQTQNLKDILEGQTKHLVAAIGELPTRVALVHQETEQNQNRIIGMNEAGCRNMQYAVTSSMKGQSSLGRGFRHLKGAGVYYGDSDLVESTADGNGSNPGDIPEPTREQAVAAITADPDQKAAFHTKSVLDKLKERAGDDSLSYTELLKPELLISDSGRVLSDEPGDDNISDSERMDTLLTLLNANRPSTGSLLAKSAGSVDTIKRASQEHIANMEMSIPLTVVDKLIRARRPLPASVGMEDYLRAVMGNQSPSDAVSADDFVYLTSHYRVNDPEILGKSDISQKYALVQYAQMEAEALAMKYRRWVFKRDTNLMLAQILANNIEKE